MVVIGELTLSGMNKENNLVIRSYATKMTGKRNRLKNGEILSNPSVAKSSPEGIKGKGTGLMISGQILYEEAEFV